MSHCQTLLKAGVQTPLLNPSPGLNHPETPQIKEEPEKQSIKQEEEQLPVCVSESDAVCMKKEESSLLPQTKKQHKEETQGGDTSSESHFHLKTEGHTEHSSDTDNDDDWEPSSRSPAQHLPRYKSEPATSSNVNSRRVSGIEGPERKTHQCPVCSKKFRTKYKLQIHIRIHTGERPYSCTLCTKTFTHKSNLDLHMRTHTGEKSYCCSKCEKTFSQKGNLQTHMRTHSGESATGKSEDMSGAEGAGGKEHKCSVCQKRFGSKQLLQIHSRIHTGERPYSCTVCEKTFTQTSNLQRHMGTHTGTERKHQCSVCTKKYGSKHDLLKHIRVHTGERPYGCSLCIKTFAQSSSLTAHMRTHTGERPYNCSLCTETFVQKTHLDRHMKNHRGDIIFNCSICQMDFKYSSSLQEHLQTHRKEDSSCLRSSLCDRTTVDFEKEHCDFKMKDQRKRQLLDSALSASLNLEIPETPQIKEEPEEQSVKHEEEQLPVFVPWSSSVCVKTEISSLLQQRQTDQSTAAQLSPKYKSGPKTSTSANDSHTSEAEGKKHQCPFCQKRFVTKQVLQNHIKIHTGERLYSCPTCKKTFSQNGNLQTHMRTHTGERPFSCFICKKTFIQQSNLKAHMTTHTGEKSFSCLVCKKTFGWKRSLNIHMAVHTDERPFCCSLCKKTFTQKCNLNTHMKTHRKEGKQTVNKRVAERQMADVTLKCSICDMGFKDSSFLKEHLVKHTEEKPSNFIHSLLLERTTVESDEEQCVSKEKKEKQQLLDLALSPRVLPPRAAQQTPSLSSVPGLNLDIIESLQIKEEPEEQNVKEEEEQLPVCVP